MDEINLKIIPFFSKNDETAQVEMIENIQIEKLDCHNSRVVSQNGTHEELANVPGLYKKLWDIQGELEDEFMKVLNEGGEA